MKLNITDCKDCKSFNTSVFCGLSADFLRDIDLKKKGYFFPKGKTIFLQGDHSNGIHCITSGKVKIYKFGVDKNQIVRVANKSDIIGYRSLVSNEVFSASAEALEDTHTCYIPKRVFFNLIDNDKGFTLKLMRILSKNLKDAESNSMNIAQKTVIQRLAEFIILKHKSLEEEKRIKIYSLYFSRKDLAAILGCANETLIRALSHLKKEKLINIDKKEIIIRDIKKLYRIANLFD